MARLKPCCICGKAQTKIEIWSSSGIIYMVKCNNTNCPVPENGYPTGRNLEKVKDEWNQLNETK